jgi:hypothetical protein
MPAFPLPIVTLAVGGALPPIYLTRIRSMLERHAPRPTRLLCLTDKPAELPTGFEPIDLRGKELRRKGMRPTTNKILLLEPGFVPSTEFLYLDLTLVVQRSLEPLLDFAASRVEPLIAVRDWHYDSLNTCVMRIRSDERLGAVVRAFREGREFPHKVGGDQDFITAAMRDLGLESLAATFPEGIVESYKHARNVYRENPAEASRMLREATIVKFHGVPRMHELLSPWQRLWRVWRRFPGRGFGFARFWAKELREVWR